MCPERTFFLRTAPGSVAKELAMLAQNNTPSTPVEVPEEKPGEPIERKMPETDPYDDYLLSLWLSEGNPNHDPE